jgi:hemerythrin HHE cation binding domain-containing protein
VITMNDQQAADAIRAHHDELQAGIGGRVATLEDAVRANAAWLPAKDDVLAFLETELLPHAAAEERALYPAGLVGRSEMLVSAMIDEHRSIVAQVDALRQAADPIAAVAAASAVLALFTSHLAKENDRLIPVLVADPAVSLETLLGGMHELLG